MREVLQRNPVAALAAEQVLYEVTRAYPMLSLTSGLVYRSWLADTVLIAIAPFRAA